MTRIGLISDTHGYLDPRLLELLSDVDEVWHAGDIGSMAVLEQLRAFKPLRAVYGNADGQDIRQSVEPGARLAFSSDPEERTAAEEESKRRGMLSFKVEGVEILMTHIGGYPGKYSRTAAAAIKSERPQIFVAGHSHILRVMYDKVNDCLHLNPGACGHYGIHTKRTALRFAIDGTDIKEMEIIELNPEKQ